MEGMEILGWTLTILLFVVGMAGAIYPVLPGALAIYGGFFAYGLCISFEPFGVFFWLFQTLIVVVLFVADYLVNSLGVKRFGGTRASIIGSNIGILVGPFVIPAFGLIIGPFVGAVIGESMHSRDWKHIGKVGLGSIVGLFSSIIVKVILQLLMIIIFVIWITRYGAF